MIRHVGKQRAALIKKVGAAYRKGRSIREIGEEFGFSYGKAHSLVRESGAKIRPRGGDNRRSAA